MDTGANPTSGPGNRQATVRGLYDIGDPALAAEFIDELIENMTDEDMPEEVRSLAGKPNWELLAGVIPR